MQITLLRNRLVITNKKVTKNQNETIHAGKEENEEMSKSMTKISTRPDIFAARDYSDDCVTSIWFFTSSLLVYFH